MAAHPRTSLTITSSETVPVHQSGTQTLTFDFGADVAGFDPADIEALGADKGIFTPVSASQYTLEITGVGGAITVSVPQDSVMPRNNAATFSNFYQDTWTLDLPGDVPMELIRIPAGTFAMGSPETELSREENERLHPVTITQDFYLGKTEGHLYQFSFAAPN